MSYVTEVPKTVVPVLNMHMMYGIVMLQPLICSEHSYSTTLDLVGRQIWRGALLLADFVLHHGPSLLQGHTVLELGSGVGLTSIVAAMFATEVICTGDINFVIFLCTASWHHAHV
jgi:predicted nicotinamide N-methyase